MNVGFPWLSPLLFALEPYGLTQPILRVALPFSVKLLWELPHKHAQMCLLVWIGDSKAIRVDTVDEPPQ